MKFYSFMINFVTQKLKKNKKSCRGGIEEGGRWAAKKFILEI